MRTALRLWATTPGWREEEEGTARAAAATNGVPRGIGAGGGVLVYEAGEMSRDQSNIFGPACPDEGMVG